MTNDDLSTLEQDLETALAEQVDAGAEPAAEQHPDDPSWRVTPKADAEPEPESLSATLDRTAAEQEAPPAADTAETAAWDREWRKLADQALRDAGIDPAQRHEAGLSRREAVRRLFRGEQMLRQDLSSGLRAIVESYGSSLSPEQRAGAARAALEASGYSLSGLTEAERGRLSAYDQAQAQRQAAYQGALPAAQQTLEQFRAQHADLDQHRDVMAALIRSGRATTLEQAYEQAALLSPGAFEQRYQARAIEDAKRAAEERRASVAKAKNAATPKTASVQAPPPDLSGMPLKELLEHQYNELAG